MKSLTLLQLAAVGYGLVIPDANVFNTLETLSREVVVPTVESIEHDFQNGFHKFGQQSDEILLRIDEDLDRASVGIPNSAEKIGDRIDRAYYNVKSWVSSTVTPIKDSLNEDLAGGLEALGIEDYSRPHHGGHHHQKPNKTVYELIATSKYTTKLADLISNYDDLVKLLNGTSANFTVFAPTDHALEHFLAHHPKPSSKQVKQLLAYHVSDDFYPAGRILTSRTIPTLLEDSLLGEGNPQRLATEVSFRGLTVNFYSRVVAVNIFGTNGVIHGINAPLLPPPSAFDIINYLPSEFSTLTLGLAKTGLDKVLNSSDHQAGTFFAPSNYAFSKLGPRLNGFLFSEHGLKYLKAILEYHVVPSYTLYSDTLYNTTSTSDYRHSLPKGLYHIDLPTLLKDRSLSVDVARYGRLIEIKINAFFRVSVSDGIAKDGVIHVLQEVLIPPKELGGTSSAIDADMTIDELRDRLEPLVENSADEGENFGIDWYHDISNEAEQVIEL